MYTLTPWKFASLVLFCSLFAQASWGEVKVFVKLQPNDKQLEETRKSAQTAVRNKRPTENFDEGLWSIWTKQQADTIKKRFYAMGFYNASVDIDNQYPKKINFNVNVGTPYLIKQITVQSEPVSEALEKALAQQLELKVGERVVSDDVLAQESVLSNYITANYCFFNNRVTHQARLDKSTQQVSIEYQVNTGVDAKLNAFQFSGLETVSEAFLQRLLSLEDEDRCFSQLTLQDAIIKLQQTNLFSQIYAKLPDAPQVNGDVDVIFQLQERPHRTLSSSLRYDPDKGAGVELGWEHRNFFGNGERLSVTAMNNEDEWELATSFTKPYFYHPRQSLAINQSIGEKTTNAFDSEEIGFSVGLSRSINDRWSANVGLGYEYSKVTDNGIEDEFSLISLPISASYDSRDDLLDPKKGHFVNVQFSPYANTDELNNSFQSSIVTGMLYYPMPFWKASTLATRVSGGAITGTSKNNVPKNKRFYVGGGGSVRGFPFQSIGPFEVDRDGEQQPAGGLNFFETSIEWRMPITSSIGLVMFADGGNSFDDFNSLKNTEDEKIFWGGGLGLRYFTDFGPIRFDIASPITALEEEKGFDDQLQFYFSIGQSF